jgi:universal stress protein A
MMDGIDRILVPVDFSPCSDAALRWALSIADACGAEVCVLHVWCPRHAPHANIFADSPEGHALECRLSEAEAARPTARVSGRLEFGEEPSTVILDILSREPFDLVVIGRHGDGGREPFGGHVASRLATVAPCPVVRLRPTGEPEAA